MSFAASNADEEHHVQEPQAVSVAPRSNKGRRGASRKELFASELNSKIDVAIATKKTAELAVLYLMDQYMFDLQDLIDRIHAKGLDVSFSRVTYNFIAPLVGLNPSDQLLDIPTFNLERARITTSLFKKIVKDMHLSLNQYGPPDEHRTEQARSRFLAPLMNRLVGEFNLLIQNTPDSIMPGRLTTKGSIEYQFKVCGALTVLFVEAKPEIGSSQERQNAVALVIAEADACDFMNSKLCFTGPIYVVLCDGKSFDFFTFQGSTRPPRIFRGLFHHPRGGKFLGLDIPSYERSLPEEFITFLRPICEMLFAMFLRGYILGLRSYHERSLARAATEGKARENTPAWIIAITLAEEAMMIALGAAEKARQCCMDEANEMAGSAWGIMKESLESAPQPYRRDNCNLIAAWDDSFSQI